MEQTSTLGIQRSERHNAAGTLIASCRRAPHRSCRRRKAFSQMTLTQCEDYTLEAAARTEDVGRRHNCKQGGHTVRVAIASLRWPRSLKKQTITCCRSTEAPTTAAAAATAGTKLRPQRRIRNFRPATPCSILDGSEAGDWICDF
jgi:hypothetical protein